MTILRKTALSLACIFLVVTVMEALFFHRLISVNFTALEGINAARSMERVVRAIQGDITHLSGLTRDWAAWDDMYEFMASRNEQFITTNLPEATFENNGLNLVIICDSSGKVVWARAFDPKLKWLVLPPELAGGALPAGHPLLCPQVADNGPFGRELGRSGIFSSSRGPILIASEPILKSSDEGPCRGTLIFGEFLDASAVQGLSRQTLVPLSIVPAAEARPFRGDRRAKLVRDGQTYVLDFGDSDKVAVSTTLKDLTGKSPAGFSAVLPRTFYERGLDILSYSLMFTLAAFFVSFLAVLVSFRKTVLSPVSRLTTHALGIEATGDLSARLYMRRRDEIGALAGAFDRMVERMEEAQRNLGLVNEDLVNDVTQREALADTLRRREEYFRLILSSMHDEIVVIGPGLVVEDANKDFLPKLGLNLSEIKGRPFPEVFSLGCPHCDKRGEACRISEVFATGRPASGRVKLNRPEGPAYLDVLISPVTGPDGGVERVISAYRDVTAEAELSSRLSAMRKMQAVGALAGGVAHDFNNILMSMLLNIEYALKKSGTSLPVKDALDGALASGRRARDLIAQLLAFSRGAADRPMVFSVSPVVKETVKLIRATAPAAVTVNLTSEAGRDTVKATPSAIQQVVVNLCSNAIWAMREKGGELSVNLSDAGGGGRDMLRLWVRDTGPGMEPEVLEHLFEPFFTTKLPGEGTGLGLAVVHGLVTDMGGSVRAENRADGGSAFEVLLPLSEPEAVEPEPPETPLDGRFRILLVEDETFLAESLGRLLETMGFRVTVEPNGMNALSLVTESPARFDLVVSDFAMPSMSGLGLAREIRRRGYPIPVILVTGYCNELTEGELEEAGVRALVRKPVSAGELSRIILGVIKGK